LIQSKFDWKLPKFSLLFKTQQLEELLNTHLKWFRMGLVLWAE